MTGEIRVQDELLHFVNIGIEQNVLKKKRLIQDQTLVSISALFPQYRLLTLKCLLFCVAI